MEPEMKCESRLCGKMFAKRHVACPYCGKVGISMLYRHRPVDSYFWKMLTEKKMWCPQAHTLNDPFEFDFHLTEHAIDGIAIVQAEMEQAQLDVKNYGVISFVEVNDSILMWSHYSASHTGVCLGFERNETNILGNWDHCVPVYYHPDNEKLSVRPLELNASLDKILTTKAKDWSYEREWRLITHVPNREIEFPGRLAEVVFGLSTEMGHRKRIIETLGNSVRYFQAEKSSRYYALEIVPV